MRKLVFFFLVLFVPFQGGCIRFYGHEKFVVNVIDAEDEMPVEGAKVSPRYIFFLVLNPPKFTEATTNQIGMAELKVAKFYPRHLEVKAKGYYPFEASFSENYWGPNLFKARNKNDILVLLNKRKPK